MKKAKRLLAVLLAAIMIFSVAVVPGYATNLSSDNFRVPNEAKGFYWFTYEQSCGYVLDLLDNLLKEGNLTVTAAKGLAALQVRLPFLAMTRLAKPGCIRKENLHSVSCYFSQFML